MDIEIICNTPDEELFENVRSNSRYCLNWVKMEEPHDGHAVIVGSGPSLQENLHLIKKRRELGQKIFALNGACKFLNKQGIFPDYQVILDARPENLTLLSIAKEYLIASQCYPALVESVPHDLTLWHPAIENITQYLPEYFDDYALIGGGTTVGLSAMCLAYTMGYRKLHLFGYDSSHRQKDGHAFKQAINNNDQLCKVTMGGKVFTASLTMARQAELFPIVANQLIDAGCTITVDADGLISEVVRMMHVASLLDNEKDKYEMMWENPLYRHTSPGQEEAARFVDVAKPTKDQKVIDFGCGTGRGAKAIHDLVSCEMQLVDFASNALDKDVALPFVVSDLTQPMAVTGDIGYCTDVMEHIQPELVEQTISNIMACVRKCYFRIALFDDNMGQIIGHPLHLSVFPADWWADKFSRYKVLYRDDGEGEFPSAIFYVQRED